MLGVRSEHHRIRGMIILSIAAPVAHDFCSMKGPPKFLRCDQSMLRYVARLRRHRMFSARPNVPVAPYQNSPSLPVWVRGSVARSGPLCSQPEPLTRALDRRHRATKALGRGLLRQLLFFDRCSQRCRVNG
jgi:hypothetical protein